MERRRGFVTGGGAVCLIVESAASCESRGVRPWGTVEASGAATWAVEDVRAGGRAVERVLRAIGDPAGVLCSGNQTWLDAVERIGVRRWQQADECARGAVVSGLYSSVGECFAVMGLASVAAALLLRAMPAWHGPRWGGMRYARGGEEVDSMGVLCSDHAGSVCAVRLGLNGERVVV